MPELTPELLRAFIRKIEVLIRLSVVCMRTEWLVASLPNGTMNWQVVTSWNKLTPDIIRAFILRIIVYEKEEKFSRKCGNYIEIHYTFQPKPRTTSKTAVSTIAVIPMELQMAAINA